MALRVPPGRAGRLWLLRRLEIARRGADLLDRKRQALLRAQAQVRAQAADADRAWRAAARDAELWCGRAAIADGSPRLAQLARHVEGEASAQVSWTNLMGARLPADGAVTMPELPPLAALGAGAATVLAARACREATAAAARYAVARRAEEEVAAELGRAARRLRALRHRWIPQHEQALAALDLTLDEAQREQAARVRWLAGRGAQSPTA